MGVSTDAILFFGFALEEEAVCPWGDEDDDWYDWEKHYAERIGVDPEDYEKRSKVAKKSGCEINRHCSGDYPMRYVTHKDLNMCANRGYPHVIKEFPVPTEKQIKQLKAFVEVMGIEVEGEPAWHLVSYWG